MGTCHSHVGKNLSTDALNMNMTNTRDPRKGVNHPHKDHHPLYQPPDNHVRIGVVLVGGGG